MSNQPSRRQFLQTTAIGTALGAASIASAQTIPGFDDHGPAADTTKTWTPVSDRKVRVGIAGYGYCKFGAAFGLQDHPNVELVGVTDLFADRRAGLMRATRCERSYTSLEEMVKDDRIEAIFCATDAPSHARHARLVLEHGKHVSSAVPATFGSIEEGEQLLETVRRTELKYMMFETSCYRADCCAMRALYRAGALGKVLYSEGEYNHYHASKEPTPSYKGWRRGLPPLWYPTHSTAYLVGVTDESFTSVSCIATPGRLPYHQFEANPYGNSNALEVGLFETSSGGTSRMMVAWNARPAPGIGTETGRVLGQFGSSQNGQYTGTWPKEKLPNLSQPLLPPGVPAGGHGGSHGRLGDEWISAILQNRQPLVDIIAALNMTVPGIVAHQSAMKDGERLPIPQYRRSPRDSD